MIVPLAERVARVANVAVTECDPWTRIRLLEQAATAARLYADDPDMAELLGAAGTLLGAVSEAGEWITLDRDDTRGPMYLLPADPAMFAGILTSQASIPTLQNLAAIAKGLADTANGAARKWWIFLASAAVAAYMILEEAQREADEGMPDDPSGLA